MMKDHRSKYWRKQSCLKILEKINIYYDKLVYGEVGRIIVYHIWFGSACLNWRRKPREKRQLLKEPD